jgi:hypothetical protein
MIYSADPSSAPDAAGSPRWELAYPGDADPSDARSHRLKAAASWGASIAVHAAVLLSLVAVAALQPDKPPLGIEESIPVELVAQVLGGPESTSREAVPDVASPAQTQTPEVASEGTSHFAGVSTDKPLAKNAPAEEASLAQGLPEGVRGALRDIFYCSSSAQGLAAELHKCPRSLRFSNVRRR